MVNIEVGVYSGTGYPDGWLRICEQEKMPHKVTDKPDSPVIVFEKETPEWLADYLSEGGVAVITEAVPASLPFDSQYFGEGLTTELFFQGIQGVAYAPAMGSIFRGNGYGCFRLHEKRIAKNGISNGEFPVFLRKNVGRGCCFYTGLPLTKLLMCMGDTLRCFSPYTVVTERVSAIDKSLIAGVLVEVLKKAFWAAGLPYVRLWYYPNGEPTMFAFRVDVDGVYGTHLTAIARTAEEYKMPISFFVNRSLCQGDESFIKAISDFHEIGNHGDVHNLHDSLEDNISNIQQCSEWMRAEGISSGPWFVAPRGMWNWSLHQALEALGYEYSSDFGLEFDGLPFFPRINNRRSSVLQIPIHPYSVERAFAWSSEENAPEPTSETVADYFKKVVRDRLKNNLPAFFYGHPQYLGTMAHEVLPELMAAVTSLDIKTTTLTRFARWWLKRDATRYSVTWDEEDRQLVVDGTLLGSVYLNVLTEQLDLTVEGIAERQVMFTKADAANEYRYLRGGIDQ